MRPPLRLLLLGLLVAALVTGGVVAVGTVTAEDDVRDDEPFRTTALEDFETTRLVVRRASFCSAIDPRQGEAALGTAPESEDSWSNGDRIELADGVRDVVHEFGCEYVAAGTTARAWVFAPPVSKRRARQLVKAAEDSATDRCSGLSGNRFGEPSSVTFCGSSGLLTATFAGLFGDAWLACQLEADTPVDDDDFADTAGRWCVGVLQAASSEPTAVS